MKGRSLLIAAAALFAAAPAGATCLDEVHALAESHSLTSKPPVAAPDARQGPGVTTHQLSRSGGVIAPPPTADNSVIKPPADTDPGMKTVPDATAKAAGAGQMGAERPALQTALTAARSAAERGDEQACRDGLAKARQLAEKP